MKIKMENELYHFGIKGMKWGIRRYQNADGSLTTAGKKRYAKNRELKLDNFDLKTSNVMLGKTPAKEYKWYDETNQTVAEFKTWNWWDGINVSDLEINEKYRGNKLSYQLLDYAVKKCGARNMAVNKNNYIAKHVYDKYGFEITDEDDTMYYMSINDQDPDDGKPWSFDQMSRYR